jgi:hypothetical protein
VVTFRLLRDVVKEVPGKRSLGDEKYRRGGKGKCGLVSSDLQDVYIGEPIGDESGYKIYSSEFQETETFTSGRMKTRQGVNDNRYRMGFFVLTGRSIIQVNLNFYLGNNYLWILKLSLGFTS